MKKKTPFQIILTGMKAGLDRLQIQKLLRLSNYDDYMTTATPIVHNDRIYYWNDGMFAGFVNRWDNSDERNIPVAVWNKMNAKVYGIAMVNDVKVILSDLEIAKICDE